MVQVARHDLKMISPEYSDLSRKLVTFPVLHKSKKKKMRCLILLVLIALVSAVTVRSARVEFETRQKLALPHGYEVVPYFGDRTAEQVRFLIALKQRNIGALKEILYEVSMPRSPAYISSQYLH